MMKYEALRIELVSLDSSDVIATSAAVTTEKVLFPWETNSTATTSNVMPSAIDLDSYEM